MAKVRITQRRSVIDRPIDQKLTVKSLGLCKIDKYVEVEFTPQIKGMVNKVGHLVTVTAL
jgi:large subunit ribosomal protein L30